MDNEKLFSRYSLLMVLACLGINLAGTRLALWLELPLFLDSTGTILAAVLGGYLPGIVVGFATNCVAAWTSGDEITMYYGILNILIAISAVWLAKRGVFRSFFKSMASIFIFAFIGGALGSLLTWYLYGLNIGSGISAPLALSLVANTSLGKFLSQFLADIGIDFADKAVTVVFIYFVLMLIPRRLTDKLPLGEMYRSDKAPAGGGSVMSRIAKTYRNTSLSTKITMLIIVTSIILSTLSVSISYSLYRNTMDTRYVSQCTAAVNLISLVMNGDSVKGFIDTKASTLEYAYAKKKLYDIRNNIPDIKYLYVYQIKEDGVHVVFDLDTDDTPGGAFGEVIEFDEEFKKYLPRLLAGEEIDPIITVGQFGWLLTVYKPLLDSEGKCVAYAAADISMESIKSDRYVFIIKVLSLLFGVSIVIVAFALWFAQHSIVVPLNSLASATNKFAYENEQERLQNTADLHKLNIRTGDEIEYLYSAISKTIADVFDYLRVIDEKNADVAAKVAIISKMQDNIIISFADMVENRDENTGCHIKRTAAYVRAIGEELNRNGRYKGTLTHEYIEKLEKSAPLHDIGKIKIPDAILNKPGKLTPEEFDMIKTHAKAGMNILQKMFIGVTEEDNYLSEGVVMALYHHEKWDGSGYPQGLKGDDIPLGARIMAIADVFDALMSKRSYKDSFSFNDSVSIIKGESGTHFDPDVVEAFLNIKDTLKQIAEEN